MLNEPDFQESLVELLSCKKIEMRLTKSEISSDVCYLELVIIEDIDGNDFTIFKAKFDFCFVDEDLMTFMINFDDKLDVRMAQMLLDLGQHIEAHVRNRLSKSN